MAPVSCLNSKARVRGDLRMHLSQRRRLIVNSLVLGMVSGAAASTVLLILGSPDILVGMAASLVSAILSMAGQMLLERRRVRLANLDRAHTPRGFLVDLLLPPDRAEDVLYNLLGRYPYWIERHGPR